MKAKYRITHVNDCFLRWKLSQLRKRYKNVPAYWSTIVNTATRNQVRLLLKSLKEKQFDNWTLNKWIVWAKTPTSPKIHIKAK